MQSRFEDWKAFHAALQDRIMASFGIPPWLLGDTRYTTHRVPLDPAKQECTALIVIKMP